MKPIILLRLVIVLFAASALRLKAQDFVPASVAGRTAVVIITSGTGVFASSGAYRLVLGTNTYQIVPITSNVLPSTGTYIWTKSSATLAATTVVNAQTGISASQSIFFTSPTAGIFGTNSPGSIQTGSFIWEGVTDVNRFMNISTRGVVGVDSNILIGGFVVSGTVPKRVLIRGAGPSLASFGITGVLSDPVLTIINSSGAVVGQNDDWVASEIGGAFSQVGAFAFQLGGLDSALILTLPRGAYSAQVSGKNRTTGVALIEIYELP